MRLRGKIAIVTGSVQGIGREIAMAFAEEGANIVVAERNPATMEAVNGEIKALGRTVLAIATDVTGEDRVGAVADVVSQLGHARMNVVAMNAIAAGKRRYGAILWVKPRNVGKAAEILGSA